MRQGGRSNRLIFAVSQTPPFRRGAAAFVFGYGETPH